MTTPTPEQIEAALKYLRLPIMGERFTAVEWEKAYSTVETAIASLQAENTRLKAEVERKNAALRWADGEMAKSIDPDAFTDLDAGIDSRQYWREREKMKAAIAPLPAPAPITQAEIDFAGFKPKQDGE